MAVTNSLVKKEQSFSAFLMSDAVKNKVCQMVAGKDGNKFITSLISLVSHNPALQTCDKWSVVSAALLGESLKLSCSPQLGQFYLVPFNDKNRDLKVAQFILGYKGYIQLAIRSGYYKKINVLAIKEGELISYDPLEETIKVDLIMSESQREKANTTGYYAMFEYTNGFRKAIYWTKEKMLIHADRYSQAFSKDGLTFEGKGGKTFKKVSYEDYVNGNYDKKDEWLYSSFWYKDFDEMAQKTMIRQLISKWGIMSVDFQKAYENDMAYINEMGQAENIDMSMQNESKEEITQIPEQKEEEVINITPSGDEDVLNNFED